VAGAEGEMSRELALFQSGAAGQGRATGMMEVVWSDGGYITAVSQCGGGRAWSVVAERALCDSDSERNECTEKNERRTKYIGEGDTRDTTLFKEILHFLTTILSRTVFISLS